MKNKACLLAIAPSVVTSASMQTTTEARVKSYGEIHLLAHRALWEKDHFELEGGLGLTLGFVNNFFDITSASIPGPGAQKFSPHSNKVLPGPRGQLTAHYEITPWLLARLAVAYVYYANEDTESANTYDLDFGGVLVEPGLEWRF